MLNEFKKFRVVIRLQISFGDCLLSTCSKMKHATDNSTEGRGVATEIGFEGER